MRPSLEAGKSRSSQHCRGPPVGASGFEGCGFSTRGFIGFRATGLGFGVKGSGFGSRVKSFRV